MRPCHAPGKICSAVLHRPNWPTPHHLAAIIDRGHAEKARLAGLGEFHRATVILKAFVTIDDGLDTTKKQSPFGMYELVALHPALPRAEVVPKVYLLIFTEPPLVNKFFLKMDA